MSVFTLGILLKNPLNSRANLSAAAASASRKSLTASLSTASVLKTDDDLERGPEPTLSFLQRIRSIKRTERPTKRLGLSIEDVSF